MAKLETIEALMRSAARTFSRHGYEGASLRDIAGQAGVPLGAIHVYFGTKSELYQAVSRKAWSDLDEERNAYLDAALAANAEGRILLSELIYALAHPVVRRALSKDDFDIAQVLVIRGGVINHEFESSEEDLKSIIRSKTRWIEAMTLSCPNLSRQDIVWALSFVVGVIYSWQLLDNHYDGLIGADGERSAEDVTNDIVAFGCNGIQALIDRRQRERLRLHGRGARTNTAGVTHRAQ